MFVDPEGARFRLGSAGGHYESWFLRANHPDRPQAFWLRYTVTSPAGRPGDVVAELFGIAFDGVRMRHVVVREQVPLRDCLFPTAGLDVRLGASRLLRGSALGRASSGGHSLHWDLAMNNGQDPLLLLPAKLYEAGFPKAKALVMRPGAIFTGTFEVDGERWPIDGWVGSTNHNWGERHTDQYAWGQVIGFPGAADTMLEIATARIRLGLVLSPAMTPLVLRHKGREYKLNAMRRVFRRARIQGLRWVFDASGDGARVRGVIAASPTEVVTLSYRNPPGGTKLCINSKIARCDLEIDTGRGVERLSTPHGAAFEILVDDEGVAGKLGIHGLPTAI